MNDNIKEKIDYDELIEIVRHHTTPVNIEELVRDNIIEQHGQSYKILDWERLPEHARNSIKKVTQRKDGLFVTFRKPSKKLQSFLRKHNL